MANMKKRMIVTALLTATTVMLVSCGGGAQKAPKTAYDFVVRDIRGDAIDLSTYKGKVALFVNTATECGLTPQFLKLQALYDKYKNQGFVIVGFPSNSFNQEPKTDEEIVTFCTDNFLVDFPMTKKIEVKGPQMHELYAYLTSAETNPQTAGEITWNFEKFLIGRDGKIAARFKPEVEPDDSLLTASIEKALQVPAPAAK
jgi:glutathione peroxidase